MGRGRECSVNAKRRATKKASSPDQVAVGRRPGPGTYPGCGSRPPTAGDAPPRARGACGKKGAASAYAGTCRGGPPSVQEMRGKRRALPAPAAEEAREAPRNPLPVGTFRAGPWAVAAIGWPSPLARRTLGRDRLAVSPSGATYRFYVPGEKASRSTWQATRDTPPRPQARSSHTTKWN